MGRKLYLRKANTSNGDSKNSVWEPRIELVAPNGLYLWNQRTRLSVPTNGRKSKFLYFRTRPFVGNDLPYKTNLSSEYTNWFQKYNPPVATESTLNCQFKIILHLELFESPWCAICFSEVQFPSHHEGMYVSEGYALWITKWLTSD